jgi:hypothetical protein
MGDFNDEPYNRSLREYSLSTRNPRKVSSPNAKLAYLYNCMWELMAEAKGTYYYGRWNMLDQFLINKKFYGADAGFTMESVGLFDDSRLYKNSKPRKHGRPSKQNSYDPDGYSDHLPIYMNLTEHS